MITKRPKAAFTRQWNTPLTQALDYIGHELVVMATDTEGRPSRLNFADCVIEDCTGQKGFASEVLASTKGGNRAIYTALRGPNSERLQRFFATNLRETRSELVQLLYAGSVMQYDLKRDPNPSDQMITNRTMITRMRSEYERAVFKIRDMCHIPASESESIPLMSEFPELAKLTGINSTGAVGVSEFDSDMFDDFTGLPGIDIGTLGRDSAYVAESLDALRNGQVPALPDNASENTVDRELLAKQIAAFEAFIGHELNESEIADIISDNGITAAGLAFRQFVSKTPADTSKDQNPVMTYDSNSAAMDVLTGGTADSAAPADEPDSRVPDSFLDKTDPDVQLMVKIRDALSDLDEQRQKFKNIVEYAGLMTLTDTTIYFTASTDPKHLIVVNAQLRATGQLGKLNINALRNSTQAFGRKLAAALEIPRDLIDTQVELIESDTPFSDFINTTYSVYGVDLSRMVKVQTCAAIYTVYLYKKYGKNYRVGYQLTKSSGQYSADYTVYPKEESADYDTLVSEATELKENAKAGLVIDLYLHSDMDRKVTWLHSFDCVSVPDYLTAMDDPEMSGPRNEIGTEIFSQIKPSLVNGIALIIKSKIPGADVVSSSSANPVDENLSFDLLFKVPGPVSDAQRDALIKEIDITQYSDKSMTMMLAPISSSIKVGATIEIDEAD